MVIGAGVAGQAAARALLDLGINVILVDRSASSIRTSCESDPGILVLKDAKAVGAENTGAIHVEVESMQGRCRQRGVHDVSAVILATGLVPIDASLIPEFGMGRHANVLSAIQLDSILSSADELRRPSDGGPVSSVVFVQCVGSRVEKRGVPYCCAVCCASSIDCAIKLKLRDPRIAVHVLYIDIRMAGKGQESMYKRARQLDVKFIRGQPALVAKKAGTEKLLVCGENTLLRELYELSADMVVLALGSREDPENLELFNALGVELDGEGLIRTGEGPDQAVRTSARNVFVAGSASAPMGIEEAKSMGVRAAHAAYDYLRTIQ
jgi:heterodisulfide reductase subunit A-like polyferredoxin